MSLSENRIHWSR